MAEKLFYVSSTDVENLIKEWQGKDKPAEYTFTGFVIKHPAEEDKLFFHPLYLHESPTEKSVLFVSALTSGECPTPPGYSDPISSWSDNKEEDKA